VRHTIRFASFVAIIVASMVSTIPAQAGETEIQTAIGNDTCCFSNPRYTGICQVTTGPDETCSDVLSYLNNQASVGKTYCGNTKVRGGWAQADCDGSSSTCTPTRSIEPSPGQ